MSIAAWCIIIWVIGLLAILLFLAGAYQKDSPYDCWHDED